MTCKVVVRTVFTIAVLAMAGCSTYHGISAEKIAERVQEAIKARDFENLYPKISGRARSMTPKDEFLQRADALRAALVKGDPELKFVKSREGGINPDFISDIHFEFRTVGSGASQMEIEIWVDVSGIPRLYD